MKNTVIKPLIISACLCLSLCGCATSAGNDTGENTVSTQAMNEKQEENDKNTQSSDEFGNEKKEDTKETAKSEETIKSEETDKSEEAAKSEETAKSEEAAEAEKTDKAADENAQTPQESDSQAKSTQTAALGSIKEGDFGVMIRGQFVPVGADMGAYEPLLGTPDEYTAAKSCIENGDDKIYTYDGTKIYTYLTNGADYLSLIEIYGNGALPSGIHIGSARDEVTAAYGDGYIQEGDELLYELGGKTIGIEISSDTVSFIELFTE